MADESVPPFDPKGCRYDQRTYAGRLSRFREMTDPRTLFVGDEELAKVIAALSLSTDDDTLTWSNSSESVCVHMIPSADGVCLRCCHDTCTGTVTS